MQCALSLARMHRRLAIKTMSSPALSAYATSSPPRCRYRTSISPSCCGRSSTRESGDACFNFVFLKPLRASACVPASPAASCGPSGRPADRGTEPKRDWNTCPVTLSRALTKALACRCALPSVRKVANQLLSLYCITSAGKCIWGSVYRLARRGGGPPKRTARRESRASMISRGVSGVPGGERPGFIRSRMSP